MTFIPHQIKYEDGTRFPAKMRYCLYFTGHQVPQTVTVKLNMMLDYEKPAAGIRLLFLSNNQAQLSEKRIILTKQTVYCRDEDVYVKSDVRDKVSAIRGRIVIELENSGTLPPVLDAKESSNLTNTMNIVKNCGDDNICESDLKLTASL